MTASEWYGYHMSFEPGDRVRFKDDAAGAAGPPDRRNKVAVLIGYTAPDETALKHVDVRFEGEDEMLRGWDEALFEKA